MTKQIRRTAVLLLTTVLMLTALAACDSGKTPADPSSSADPAEGKVLEIPATRTELDHQAINDWELTAFAVDGANERFVAVDGVLFSRDMTTLIRYPVAKSGTEYTLPFGVKTIGEGAFESVTELKFLTLPASVTAIEKSAFYNCAHLTDVRIPATLARLEESAFKGCPFLAGMDLSATAITAIGREAFSDCYSLKSVRLPEALTEIGSGAFSGCHMLAECKLPAALTVLGGEAFSGCSALKTLDFAPCTALTSIGSGFCGCTALEKVTLPAHLTAIPDAAFRNTALTTLTVPSEVKSIGALAFAYCPDLTTVTIVGANVEFANEDGLGYPASVTEGSPNVSFLALAGSTAEAYAAKWNIPCTVY